MTSLIILASPIDQFTWPFCSTTRELASTPSCKSSFVFDLEISGPLLKRSGIDIQLSPSPSEETLLPTSVLTIDTFAGGMEEYVGPDPEAEVV